MFVVYFWVEGAVLKIYDLYICQNSNWNGNLGTPWEFHFGHLRPGKVGQFVLEVGDFPVVSWKKVLASPKYTGLINISAWQKLAGFNFVKIWLRV